MPATTTTDYASNGARLTSEQGADLPLKGVRLQAMAAGGLARVVLRQTYRNDGVEPLLAIYRMPLPFSGAVAGYEFRIGDRTVRGVIDDAAAAAATFEKALLQGRTAGLLEQERPNLFTQRLGNIPPATDIAVEVTIHQRLDWLSEGMWEWRFPTVIAPRYLGGSGRVEDAPDVTVDVTLDAAGPRATLDLDIHDELLLGAVPQSPTHAIRPREGRIALEGEGARLDRDIVVRWPVAGPRPGLSLRCARPALESFLAEQAFGVLAIVPPASAGPTLPRDLIVLIDTSGSMTGPPLFQAKRVLAALIDSLDETDRLEMLSFDTSVRRWSRRPTHATAEARRDARRWIEGLEADGGTEMTSALMEALRPLRPDAQRQVILVTDGLIGFESEIVQTLSNHLPSGSRLHAVGIGSSVNRALTGPAARAGRGVEVVVDLDEAVARGADRLVRATRRPVVVDIEISGAAATGTVPRRLSDLMAASPVLVGLRLRPEGGELTVRGRTADGTWEERLQVPPTAPGEGDGIVTALYGRESVEDLEMDYAAGGEPGEIDSAVKSLGLKFGISTRLTSWVAVSEEQTVDPRQPVRISRIPQELPYGLSAEGLGLREIGPFDGARGDVACVTTRFRMEEVLDGSPAGRFIDWMSRAAATPFVHLLSGVWITGLADGVMILQFEVGEEPIDWDPSVEVELQIESERKPLRLTPIADLSTAAGSILPGRLVRIALSLGPIEPLKVRQVRVRSGGSWIRIQV